MKKVLVLMLVGLTNFSIAQITEIKYKVRVTDGIILKQEVEPKIFNGENKLYRSVRLPGYANITSNTKGDSLLINYWLDNPIEPKKGNSILLYNDKQKKDKSEKSIEQKEASPVINEQEQYLATEINVDTFNIIRPLVDQLLSMQDKLYTLDSNCTILKRRVKQLKDTLDVLSDTLLNPNRNAGFNNLYNETKGEYAAIYKRSIDSLNKYEKLKSDYLKFLNDKYQKELIDHNISWFPVDRKNIFKEVDPQGKIVAIHAVKYDRTTDYKFRLENRQYQMFFFQSWDVGAVTIPFKYRFSYNKNNVAVPDELTANINLGIFGGKSLGWITYKYRRNGELTPNVWRVTLGGFASPSIISIDSNTTSADANPLKTTRTIGALSVGGTLMISAYNFRFGIFGGWDLGVGDVAKQWNYNRRMWVGVGLGYSLNSLTFAPKE